MIEMRAYEAGIWDQITAEDGDGFVAWSRHATRERAEAAARSYARQRQTPTGGALSWAGGVKGPDGVVRWMDGAGCPAPSCAD